MCESHFVDVLQIRLFPGNRTAERYKGDDISLGGRGEALALSQLCNTFAYKGTIIF